MKRIIITIPLFAMILATGLTSCEKTEYSFGEIKAPTELALNTVVEGANTNSPDGNGSGNVAITATSNNAINYRIDFGDGTVQMVPSGKVSYKYKTPGTKEYTITVNAVGTGGVMSTISKKVKVFVAFEIPTAILQALTNGSSKTWVTDKMATGHIGVGPVSSFEPIWYQAAPNEKDYAGCLYDDEITFTKDANNNVTMVLDNKGSSFVQAASVGYYGFSGPEACYDINTSGSKALGFGNASSGSSSAQSTGIQFTVPGDGIINFATGNNTYEILSITETTMHLRNIGVDGNAWYQKLKVK
ncbi:PKD domain-containing protein [Flavihumibacter rivuli]|uniref:PKD domain-containing protein n=1 Tax=Flavihumibacter rivuli TaxID=2838156 RepID=UPI001BDDD3C2|nr:PKD domain-containing protein [Flavihumibacter rivuli]ULQ55228.1 PKD domain-containing protein [Flavihumibacter rivuli]